MNFQAKHGLSREEINNSSALNAAQRNQQILTILRITPKPQFLELYSSLG